MGCLTWRAAALVRAAVRPVGFILTYSSQKRKHIWAIWQKAEKICQKLGNMQTKRPDFARCGAALSKKVEKYFYTGTQNRKKINFLSPRPGGPKQSAPAAFGTAKEAAGDVFMYIRLCAKQGRGRYASCARNSCGAALYNKMEALTVSTNSTPI